MISRRLLAFRTNAQRLIDRHGKLYLWTFTLPAKMHPKDGAKMWRYLLKRLCRWVPDWAGIRVFEEHPGGQKGLNSFLPETCSLVRDSHGLHVHFVSTRFYFVEEVRAVCVESGWGRIHVVGIKGGKQGRQRVLSYLAKYLTKARPERLAGMRLVGYVGIEDVVRHRDIVSTGHTRDLWEAARELPGWAGLNFFGRMGAVRAIDNMCLREGGSPYEQVLDLQNRRVVHQIKMDRASGRNWTQDAERQGVKLLYDLGIIEADDNNRARRFLSKARQMPKQKVVLAA